MLGDADAITIETKEGPRVYTLKDASEPYRHLVERMTDAAVVLDQDGTIFYCNGRLADMLGHYGLAGYNFVDLVTTEQRSRAERLLVLSELNALAELNLISADGDAVPVRIAAAPMKFDDQPCVALVVTALDDIAALKASEAALRESEARVLLAQEAGGVGWELDLVTGIPVWSQAHFTLLGLHPASCGPSYDARRTAIHPDDRMRADATLQGAIAAGEAFETDYRVVWSDRTIRCLGAGRLARNPSEEKFAQ